MINFNRFVLDNGLRVLVHEDSSTPLIVVNTMYDVGSRDESPDKTGIAHLFEHFMFGGSLHIPDYDNPLQRAGGENNAYTTHDVTNYYCQLPAQNIETALWLESDRMLGLAFNKNSLEVQKKVVTEEFKEHYINKPYGMAWHKLRDLCFDIYPYKWMIIGKELSDIEGISLTDVKSFYQSHYNPSNAVLVISGNITTEHAKMFTDKWFGDISPGEKYKRNLPEEPKQKLAKKIDVEDSSAPLNALYKAWHSFGRLEKGFYISELITEILGGSASSRLYQSLVKEKKLFSNIQCLQFGNIGADLLAIEGKLVKGVGMHHAENAVIEELEKMKTALITDEELEKVKNKTESVIEFEDISIANRAGSLAFYEILGNADLMNEELQKYREITANDIREYCNIIFDERNSNTLHYYSKSQL